MHVGIAKPRWRGETGILGACATCNFTYLARSPYRVNCFAAARSSITNMADFVISKSTWCHITRSMESNHKASQSIWMKCLICYYIMAGHVIVVVKDITLLFYHENAVILTLWWWLNYGKWFVGCKFNYFNNHLWLVKNNNHLKPRYTEPCNFLTKRAWVSQQCTLVVAKDSNIPHYLNSWAYLVMILAII